MKPKRRSDRPLPRGGDFTVEVNGEPAGYLGLPATGLNEGDAWKLFLEECRAFKDVRLLQAGFALAWLRGTNTSAAS